MAGLQDEAEKSNEHLDRVEEILQEIRDSQKEEAQATGQRGALGGFDLSAGGGRREKERGLLDDPKVAALISALKFVADKATNQIEAMAKLEAALSLQARTTAQERVGDIGAALARAGFDAPPEMLERLAARELAMEQAAMRGRRAGRGAAQRVFVGLGMSEEEEEKIRQEAADQGFVSQQVVR